VPPATQVPATTRPQPTSAPQPTEPATAEPTTAPTQETTSGEPGSLRATECQFDEPAGYTIECGFLTVPEHRAVASGRTIELAVAVFKSTSDTPSPDPMVYLEGGPGGHALQALDLVFQDRFEAFLAERDVIIFDQRGVGYSKPSLDCDEYTKLSYDLLDQNISLEESEKLFIDAMLECHDRLAAQGVDFSAYNSIASAADLADLRTALGYEEWNLYGSSYGTRLALTTMRDHPEGIRSVILDSTRSLQSSETSTPADISRSFDKLFDGCANDPACDKAFPDLRDTFNKLVDKLEQEPITGEATNPLNGQEYDILIDGETLIGLVIQGLYSSDIILQLPKAIHAAYNELDNSLLIRLAILNALNNEFLSLGMFYSVRCNEEVPFDTPDALEEADDAFPQLHGVVDQGTYTPICDAWGAGKAPAIENEPVTSDIPTLVLAGEYDPATPPDDGRAAAKTLTNSYFFEFPGLGHGPGFDGGCPQAIAITFLGDPASAPDDSCIAAMSGPSFAGTGADITLKAIESETFGFTSVVPDDWEEVSTGIYARNTSSDIAILQLALPFEPEAALDALKQQINLEGEDTPTGERKTDALEWQLYEFTIQNLPVDLALADGGDRTFIVMLISDNVERQALYDSVFLPALDAFTPTK
jgi:pimeloyl-ACP methyl ester carboxylesterase